MQFLAFGPREMEFIPNEILHGVFKSWVWKILSNQVGTKSHSQ